MATLKQLVDETTKIKNELKTCHTNLKNNLIDKGVECSNTDKLLRLANKVGEIELGKKWASGKCSYTAVKSTTTFPISCDFTPSIILVNVSTVTVESGVSIASNVWLRNDRYFSFSQPLLSAGANTFNIRGIISNLTNSSFTIEISSRTNMSIVGSFDWIAFE